MTFPSRTPPPVAPLPPSSKLGRIEASDLLLVLIIGLGTMRFLAPAFFSLFSASREAAAHPSPALTMVFLTLHSAVLVVSIRYLVLLRHDIAWADIGLGRLEARWVRLGIFGGLLCLPLVAMINLFVQGALPEPMENPQIDALTGGKIESSMLFVLLPVGAIIVPFAEEVAFRGVFFRWLSLKTGASWAILLSALFFAVLHGIPHFIPAITALGMVLAVLVQRTGSLWPAIIAHGTFNSVMILTVYSLASDDGALPAALLGGP